MENVVHLPTETAAAPVVAFDPLSTAGLILQGEGFQRMEKIAELMASGSATIPKHLHNKADCFAVVMQSMQWGMNPFAVAQKTHLVNGVLGYEAQLVNSVITSRAPVTERLHFEWYGDWARILGKFAERESKTKKDDNGYPVKYRVPAWKIEDEEGLGVKVWATFRGEKTPRELSLLMTQARTRNSTLWADDPRQQLAYLATKRWARLYCPDVIMGVYTPDELQEPVPEKDMGAADVVGTTPQQPAGKPDYKESDLTADKPHLVKSVLSGKTTIERAITKIRTRFTISEQMEKLITATVGEAVTAAQQDALKAAEQQPVDTQATATEALTDDFLNGYGKEEEK